MGAIKLDCPICGAEFLRTNQSSKTCSRECSHKLVKRQPNAFAYTQPKLQVEFMAAILEAAFKDYDAAGAEHWI